MTAIDANGIHIEYESLGDPGAPAIVLIMGLGMQLIAWPDEFCRLLVERGFRVIRFDNRDAGLSTRIPWAKRPRLMLAMIAARLRLPVRSPYSLDDMAADTLGLLDALGIARAHVVGASMGGMIAQQLAARHPERVRSLTSIMSTSGNPKVSKPTPAAARTLVTRPENPADQQAVIEHLMKTFGIIGSPGYPPSAEELRARLTRSVQRAYYPAGVARQLLAVIAAGDRRRMLRAIKAPTLVIHGAADPLVPPSAGRDTAENIAGSRLLMIEGMGHDLPPALFGRITAAIAEHCAGAA